MLTRIVIERLCGEAHEDLSGVHGDGPLRIMSACSPREGFHLSSDCYSEMTCGNGTLT